MFTLELIGVAAVVVSLLFVAYQIQQSNKIARVTTEYEIRNNHSASNEIAMSDPQFASLLARMQDASYELNDGEEVQAYAFVIRTVNFWSAAGTAFENGMLTQETYDYVLDDIHMLVTELPALHPAIRRVLDNFPSIKNTRTLGVAVRLLEEYKEPS